MEEEIVSTDEDVVCLGYVQRSKPASPRFIMRKVRARGSSVDWKRSKITESKVLTPKKRKDALNTTTISSTNRCDLWIDAHKPITRVDLAIHPKKIQQVHEWLAHALKQSTRLPGILCLTGPSGSGKTACIDVLCRELGATVFEYENAFNDKSEWMNGRDVRDATDLTQTSLSKHFQEFIQNASKQSTLAFTDIDTDKSTSESSRVVSRKIIVVEDHPNILNRHTQNIVHSTLRVLCSTSSVPLVVILSDVNLEDKDTLSIRNYFPPDIMHRVHEINFNPVAVTIVKKCLKAIAGGKSKGKNGWDQAIESVSKRCLGDLRCAINTLQFQGINSSESASSRDKTSMLFSVVGKLLNQKDREAPDDVDGIISDSHIDSGMIHLYLQQNYLGYLQSIEEAAGLVDLMSSGDLLSSTGGSSIAYADSCVSRGFMNIERDITKSFKSIEKSRYWETMQESKRRGAALDAHLLKSAGLSEAGVCGASLYAGRGEYLRSVLPYTRGSGDHRRIHEDVCLFRGDKRRKQSGEVIAASIDALPIAVDEIDDICEYDDCDTY